MIIKSNGQMEAFNRAKMIASMRNAGATPQQANIAASRIVNRFPQGGQIQSQQISQMVSQSLSEVNPAASKNYVTTNEQKMAYNQRVNRLSLEISSINQQLNSLTSRIETLDNQIKSIPNRISRIRQAKYRFLTYLETDQAALAQEWNNIGPEVKTTVNLKAQDARSQAQTLQQRLSQKAGIGNYDQNNLIDIETGINPLRSSLSEIYTSINTAISPTEQKFETINQDLTRVENTLSILQGASFPWEENETPILAIKAKELNSDQEGYLTLTNLKFVFEHENEIALKKTLFIVTEKKVVREVKVQKPIGMVTALTQGKVGFFKGTGLYVRFTQESGIPEMKFDTSGEDAECVVKQYNYIMSGEAEEHLETTTPETTKAEKEQKTQLLISCSKCGAPYTEKIYRGQTSLNCKYCGAVIAID
jgi:predicted  nucleic acid-binding Zn-ribbon protein